MPESLLLGSKLGRQGLTEIVCLEHLPNLDLRLTVERIRAPPHPLDDFLLRPNLHQAVLQAALSQSNILNAVMLVQSPKDDFFWARAGGIANPDTGQRMTADHPFRLASIAKMMTAVVVLQLIEEGRLSLETPLGQLLDAADMPLGHDVDDLSVVGYPATIVIRVGIWLAVLALYAIGRDPLFFVVLGVVGLGLVLTAASSWSGRARRR